MIETVVINLVIQYLAGLKWRVRRSEEAGSARYDLVVTDPNGKVFLLEVKGGSEPVHFATIAQLERTAHMLSEEQGETITPVLLTSQDVRPSISELADEVGVQVVAAPGSEQEAAATVVRCLEAAQ